jgi:hypothetical protein
MDRQAKNMFDNERSVIGDKQPAGAAQVHRTLGSFPGIGAVDAATLGECADDVVFERDADPLEFLKVEIDSRLV